MKLKNFFNGVLTEAESARAAIKENISALKRLNDALKKDESLLLFTLELYGNDSIFRGETVLTYFDSQFRDNQKIMLIAISQHPMAVMYASDRLKNDDSIASAAVGRTFMRFMHLETAVPLAYLSPRLREDEKVVRMALEYYPDSLRCVSETFQNKHPALILQVIQKKTYLLQYVSKEIQKKYSAIVITLIEKELSLLKFMSHNLQDQHPNIVLKAIHQHPYLLQYVNGNFQEKYQQQILDIVKLDPNIAIYITAKIPKEKILNAILEGFHAQYTAKAKAILKLRENPNFKNHGQTIDNLVKSLFELEVEFLNQLDYSSLIKFKNECEKLFRDTEKKFDDNAFFLSLKLIANTVIRLFNFMINFFSFDAGQRFSLFTSTVTVWRNNKLKESLLDQFHAVDAYFNEHESTGKQYQSSSLRGHGK